MPLSLSHFPSPTVYRIGSLWLANSVHHTAGGVCDRRVGLFPDVAWIDPDMDWGGGTQNLVVPL